MCGGKGGVVSCRVRGRRGAVIIVLATSDHLYFGTKKKERKKNTVESQDFPLHLQIFKANFCKALFIQVGRQFMPLGYESEGGM